jgi:hypothetical protein
MEEKGNIEKKGRNYYREKTKDGKIKGKTKDKCEKRKKEGTQ